MRCLTSALLLLVVGCASGTPEPVPEEPTPGFDRAGRLLVVYTNNVDGEIEPCG